jgi:hypothetical protein
MNLWVYKLKQWNTSVQSKESSSNTSISALLTIRFVTKNNGFHVGRDIISLQIFILVFIYIWQHRHLADIIQLLTGFEDNSWFVWPEDWTVARSQMQQFSQRIKQNSCCSRNQSITDLLYLIIFNAFYFNFFSCF